MDQSHVAAITLAKSTVSTASDMQECGGGQRKSRFLRIRLLSLDDLQLISYLFSYPIQSSFTQSAPILLGLTPTFRSWNPLPPPVHYINHSPQDHAGSRA